MWILARRRLPLPGVRVLAYDDKLGDYFVAEYITKDTKYPFWFNIQNGDKRYANITHWMEIPPVIKQVWKPKPKI